MKSFVRFLVLGLVLVTMMGVGLGMTSAQEGATLVIGWQQEPSLLQPVGAMVYGAAMQPIYSRDMWDWDTDRNIYPIMATEIPTFENGLAVTLENGNTQVTYSMREGMVWSDGEPITVDDCMFWHERIMMDPNSGTIQRGTYPETVESAVMVDDYTLVLTYNRPWPDFNNSDTLACRYPRHILEPQLDEFGIIDNTPYFDTADPTDVVAYGPYVFESWTVGNETTFVKNPLWDGTAPYFDRIVVRYIVEGAQQRNALENGEIDIAWAPNWGVDDITAFSAMEGVEVLSVPGLSSSALWMNYNNGGHPALQDVNVRMAIVHAIDRRTVTQALNGEGAPVARGWYANPFWPPEDQMPLLEYDPALAATMLDEAGWTLPEGRTCRENAAGLQLTLNVYTTAGVRTRENYLTYIADYLGDVGVCVRQYPVASTQLFDTYLARGIYASGAFDMAIFGLTATPLSPYQGAEAWFYCSGINTMEDPDGRNGIGFCSEEYEALDAQVAITTDPQARLELAWQAEMIMYNEMFWHALYTTPTIYAVNTAAVDPATMNMGVVGSWNFHFIEDFRPPQ